MMENQTEDKVLGCTEIKILSSEVMWIYADRKKYVKNRCDVQI